MPNDHLIVLYVLSLIIIVCCSSKVSKESDNCDACRMVAVNFMKRDNFQGGNTAWEDKKLGKYAQSETRFVEIFETLCKDEEDKSITKTVKKNIAKCHYLAEEHEEMLEEWFFRQQKNAPSLFNWLCVDQLKLCCPKNHFGPNCEPCPGGSERPCFGKGRCDGSGKRHGSGLCKCDAGYQGKLCRQCSHHHYAVIKNDSHVHCAACHKACKGGCTTGGTSGCKECRLGWVQTPKGCEDVDECQSSPCSVNMFEECVNTPGSFKCVCKEAFRREEGVCIPDPDVRRPVFLGLQASELLRLAAYCGLALACILIWLRPTVPLIALFLSTAVVVVLIEKGFVDRYIDALTSGEEQSEL